MLVISVPLLFTTLAQLERYETRLQVKRTLAQVLPSDRARVENLRIDVLDQHTAIDFTVYRFADTGQDAENRPSRQSIMEHLQSELEQSLEQAVSVEAMVIEASLERRAFNH